MRNAAGLLSPVFGILLLPVIAATAMALPSVSAVGNVLLMQSVWLDRKWADGNPHFHPTCQTCRRLFGTKVPSLLGTGLATVVFGLLALELAGAAGAALGTARGQDGGPGIALVAGAFLHLMPRRSLLVALTSCGLRSRRQCI